MCLLDTDVVSALRRRGTIAARALRWLESVPPERLFISAMTVFEIQHSIVELGRRDGARASVIQNWLDEFVLIAFHRRILAVDERIARQSAVLHAGRKRLDRDRFIAAVALVHDFTVVTRNISDYRQTGARTLDPFA